MSNIFHNVKSLVSLTIFGSERVNIVIILAHCRVNWQEVMKGEEGVEVRIRTVVKNRERGGIGGGGGRGGGGSQFVLPNTPVYTIYVI